MARIDVLVQIEHSFADEKPPQTAWERLGSDPLEATPKEEKPPKELIQRIRTNAKRGALEEILTAWLQDQFGAGGDDRVAEEHDLYIVKIGLVIATDSFLTESNTGNHGLTVGIVMSAVQRLATIEVLDLDGTPVV